MNAMTIANHEPVNQTWTLEHASPSKRPGVLSFAPGFRLDLVEERLWKGELELTRSNITTRHTWRRVSTSSST